MSRRLELELGGDRSWFNVIFLIAIGIFNIINQSTNNNALGGLSLILPFFIMSAAIFLLPFRKTILSIIFLLSAIWAHYKMVDPSGFSSATLFVLAYSYSNRNKTQLILVLFASTAIITYKASISGDSPSQLMLTLALYVFIFGNFWDSIFTNISKPIKSKLKKLTTDENTILELMCNGESQENAGAKIGHKDKHETSKVMRDIRDKLDIKTNESSYKAVAMYAKSCK